MLCAGRLSHLGSRRGKRQLELVLQCCSLRGLVLMKHLWDGLDPPSNLSTGFREVESLCSGGAELGCLVPCPSSPFQLSQPRNGTTPVVKPFWEWDLRCCCSCWDQTGSSLCPQAQLKPTMGYTSVTHSPLALTQCIFCSYFGSPGNILAWRAHKTTLFCQQVTHINQN